MSVLRWTTAVLLPAALLCFGLLVPSSLLMGQTPPIHPQPTRLTFDDTERSLSEWAAEFARRANVEIDLSRADPQRRCRLPIRQLPFWQALDQLAEQTDHRLQVTSQGNRAKLSSDPRHRVPTSIQGAFRFAVRETRSRLDLAAGQARTEVIVEAVWEPSFKAYFWQWEANSWRVDGRDGQPLAATVEGTGRFPILGNDTPELRLQIGQVPRSLTSLPRIVGRIRFVGTCQMPQFVFRLDQGTTVRQAEVEARFAGLIRHGRLRIAPVELTYPKDMPEFESFQSFLVDHEAYLRRDDGRKIRLDQFDIQEVAEGRYRLRYFLREGTGGMAELDRDNMWKLVVRVPGRIVEELVGFELRDIPLP